MNELIPSERIEKAILFIRGHKVMLDADLAELYGVETGALNRAVKRNAERFPEDFMFQLSPEEGESLRCHFGISNTGAVLKSPATSRRGRGGRRHLPYVFTEQGVAMLSSVLKSHRAMLVNVAIMRAFVRLRQVLSTNKELAHKLAELERKLENHDGDIRSLFEAIRQLMTPTETKRQRIGFRTGNDKEPSSVRRGGHKL